MITLGYYTFLTKVVGCAYRGKVEGLGTVMTLPVTVANTTPASRAIDRKGIFLTTNYVSIIVPEPVPKNDPVREYEAEQYIKGKISHTNSDGSIDFLDVSTNKVHRLEKGGGVKVDIQDDRILIYANDSKQSFRSDYDLGFYMDLLEKAPTFISFSLKVQEVPLPPQKQPFPSGKTAYDFGGLLFDYSQWKLLEAKHIKGRPSIFNGIKRERKIKRIHDFKQYLKRRYNIKIQTQTSKILDEMLPKFYKKAGRVLFVASVAIEMYDIYDKRAVKASHALDVGMLLLPIFIPNGVGLAISIAYFVTDISLMIYNDNKIGYAKGIGGYLDEWVDKRGWLEDGVIWDLTPILGPANENQLPIADPGITFSF